MRVLVTGGTGAFGAGTVRWLHRLGADPVVFARRRPEVLPPSAVFAGGDIRDLDSVRKAMAGCDAVVHLAWTVTALASPEETDAIDIGGSQNVLRAMEDAGCRRIVFASSMTAYGAHPDHPQPWHEDEELRPARQFHYASNKAKVEAMLDAAGVDAVAARATVVIGRDAESGPANLFVQPVLSVPKGGSIRLQALHQDDCGRFLATAALGGPTGPVNLAADDVISMEDIASVVGARLVRVSMASARRFATFANRYRLAETDPDVLDMFLAFPIADTTRLRDRFGFQCSYSSREALEDLAWGAGHYRYIGVRRVDRPWRMPRGRLYPFRVPFSEGGATLRLLPEAAAGEFDTAVVDAEFPDWTSDNLSEAFPGPMTPMSIELSLDICRSGGEAFTQRLPLPEDVVALNRHHLVGALGHTLYANVEVMRRTAVLSGQTSEEFNRQLMGEPLPAGYRRPRPSPGELAHLARVGAAMAPLLAGFDREVGRLESRAGRIAAASRAIDSYSDAALAGRLDQWRAELLAGWNLANLATALVSAPMATIERRLGNEAAVAVRAGAGELASAGALRSVTELATLASADATVLAILRDCPPELRLSKLRTEAPAFAERLAGALDKWGHRGPGETELANQVYADRPEVYLEAVVKALDAPRRTIPPPPPSGRGSSRLVRRAVNAIERRERARDAVVRLTHALRLAVRERGRRIAAAGAIDHADDVFYLTFDELFGPPADARERIARRRAEHERLRALPLPIVVRGPVDPGGETRGDATPGSVELIEGFAASPGVVTGRVRVVRDTPHDVEPGEILVAHATDVGWTPFFGCAGAVVTDTGGMMAHAAVVAREFGIPAVVGAERATVVLRDGMIVEVDGNAGTVRVLDQAAPDRTRQPG